MLAMQRDRRAHRVGLALQARVVDAGAAPDPILRLAAVERVIDRGRDGGVADAHFAEAQHIGLRGQRLHAERHRRGAVALVERGLLGDVAGRLFQREFVDLQRDVEGLADLVDRRAAGGEIGDHRLSDRRRKRRNALRDDAVIAGENGDQRRVDMRAARPARRRATRRSPPAGRASRRAWSVAPAARARPRARLRRPWAWRAAGRGCRRRGAFRSLQARGWQKGAWRSRGAPPLLFRRGA